MPMIANPPIVQHRPKGLIDCAVIADALTCPGQDREVVYGQTRELLKAGYLVPVAREERGKKAFLLPPENLLIADVMLRMREYGVRGSTDQKGDAFAATSLAFQHWSGGKPDWASERNPASHVIADFTADQHGWTFELHSFRHEKRDVIHYEGRLHNLALGLATYLRHGEANTWQPRAVIAFDLTAAMSFWHPRAKETREAMQ